MMKNTISIKTLTARIQATRLYLIAAMIVCVLIGVGEVKGQSPTGTLRDQLNDRLIDARVALRSQEFQRAIPALREGLDIAMENNDTEWQARFHFQLGVALQQRSLGSRSPTEGLAEAAGHYESYLKLRPQTGSALNNLAQIYTRIGREGDASTLFARAVALEDEMVGFYAFNYAEFLKERRVWGEAAGYYKKALDANPDHPEAREGLLEAYQRIDQAQLITFIWDQIDRGRDVWATTAALQALANLPQEVKPQIRREKVELLTCVAVGMSRARYGPGSKGKTGGTESEVFTMLQKLTDDPDIGPGAKEMLSVFDAPVSPEMASQSWWADRGDRYADPADGWWPRDGFRMLLRSVGSWYERRKDIDSAEAYYMQAVHLTDDSDREPDLQAIVQLADLYLASNQMQEIEELLNNTSTDLFFGKGEAYKTSNFKKIYTFHRILGIMYALTEQWGDENTITSAIFQLENALKTRDIYNTRIARRRKLELISIEARLVNLLARAYAASGKSEEAAELQLTYLADAVKAKDRFTSREILRAIEYSQLEGRQARRYERLRRSVGTL